MNYKAENVFNIIDIRPVYHTVFQVTLLFMASNNNSTVFLYQVCKCNLKNWKNANEKSQFFSKWTESNI